VELQWCGTVEIVFVGGAPEPGMEFFDKSSENFQLEFVTAIPTLNPNPVKNEEKE